MKSVIIFSLISLSFTASAFDLKGLVEKASKDEKMQAEAKDIAKKGYEYFQGDKEKKEEKPTETAVKEEKKTP